MPFFLNDQADRDRALKRGGGVAPIPIDARDAEGRYLGVAISHRRAVKMLKFLATSALLSGRTTANPSDLWVLRYVWDRVERIDPLAALINEVLDRQRDEPLPTPSPPFPRPSTPRISPASPNSSRPG